MRRIKTKEQQDKNVKRNQLIMGIILIGLMVFSTLGYAFSGGEEEEGSGEIEYNGIIFMQDNGGYWNFGFQGYEFTTRYNPQETQDISFFSYSALNNYANQPLYFISKSQEVKFEIARNLEPFILRFNDACLDEDCENDYPIKNCSIDNVIIVNEPEEESEGIYQEEKCVYITASFENQTMYADRFLFGVLGV